MAIIAVFSPPEIDNISGAENVLQFVQNPWATPENPGSSVWIECRPTFADFSGGDIHDLNIGILQIEFLDKNGRFQNPQFGDVDDTSISGMAGLPKRWFTDGFLGVHIQLTAVRATLQGSVTLYLWG